MSPKVLETCLTGFLASLAALNSDCRFKDYELCLGAVEKALARIAGKDLGSAPIFFSSANCAEYIQAYFYPSRCLEEDTLSFTYRIYQDLFGEAFGALGCARRKMVELFTADEKLSEYFGKLGSITCFKSSANRLTVSRANKQTTQFMQKAGIVMPPYISLDSYRMMIAPTQA